MKVVFTRWSNVSYTSIVIFTLFFKLIIFFKQKEEMSKVANMLVQNSGIMSHIASEHCLTCGSHRHLESLREPLKCAMMDIEKYARW